VGGKAPPYSLKARRGAEAPTGCSHTACGGRIVGSAVSKSRPWNRWYRGTGRRSGSTAAPCQPRAALAVEGSERRWNLQTLKVPALHREAERDTTGS